MRRTLGIAAFLLLVTAPVAAAALKQAQDFVKKHDKWKHPYYWAAWVLWGLSD